MSAIQAQNLTKKFNERVAVDSLNLEIAEGEFFSLLGQNGAGKTTTIRMLCCLLEPTEGDALLKGNSIVHAKQNVKKYISISPQETAIAENLSVRENLELIARIYGSSMHEAREKAAQAMQDFALAERAKDRAKSLSGGLKRRLSIAMALISDPEILFLDEPTLGLDVRARREMWKHIKSFKGIKTIVLTTHYLEEANALSDRIGIMHDGKLCALGTAEELQQQTGKNSFEDAYLFLTDSEMDWEDEV